MGVVTDERPRSGRADSEPETLARSAFRRGARLASLPLGFAGRATLGLGKRLGGAPAEQVSEQMQQRAAEQLFRVLGELKGGAMKFGQALSLFESVLPEEMAAPYRAHLSRLQDAAPPMPTSRVHAVLGRELGPDWRDSFADFDPLPAAAASIGQVHRATWADGRSVAVKVQYPGADEALRSDLKQIGRMSKVLSPLAGGMDVGPLVEELTARVSEELDYTLEAAAQQQAAEGFAGSAEFCVPAVLASTSRVMVSEWIDGQPFSMAADLAGRRAERGGAALRPVPVRRSQHGRAAARRPPSGQLQAARRRPAGGRRLRPGCPAAERPARRDGPDPADRSAWRCAPGRRAAARRGLRGLRRRRRGPAGLPEPVRGAGAGPEFQFNREWMREQFLRVKDPTASGGVAMKLNLPPSYLLIHRVWTGGLAVLSQMNARAAFGEVLEEFLPGYAPIEQGGTTPLEPPAPRQ